MSDAQRTDTPLRADEVTTLRAFLDFHRDTLRWKTDGLDQAQLATPLAPTTMTLGGLLKHLAFVEQNWTIQVLHGRPSLAPFDDAPWDEDHDWEWHSAAGDSPQELRVLYDAMVAASDHAIDEALARDGLDTLAAREHRHGGGRFSLRWILVHLIEEYARHNGHADLLREAVDGLTGQ
nr:DinB family protein [Xylanimonas cellulosilytica]